VIGGGEAVSADVIKALFGFSICLKEINKPVSYRFIKDDSCDDNEAFCTVGESLIDIDLMTEFETVIERVIELNDWRKNTTSNKPIVLEIRSSWVANVEVIDLPMDPYCSLKSQLDGCYYLVNSPRSVTIKLAVGDGDSHSPVNVSLDLSAGSTSIEGAIPKIRLAILQSLVWYFTEGEVWDNIRSRLVDIDGPIPEPEKSKRRILSKMFKQYRKTLEEHLEWEYVRNDTISDVFRSGNNLPNGD